MATADIFSLTLRQVLFHDSSGACQPPLYRTFFLIRHGESKWNKAQSKIYIPGMLDRDHSLTEEGIRQASSLNSRWKLAQLYDHSIEDVPTSMFPGVIDFSRLDDEEFLALPETNEDGDEGGDNKASSSKCGSKFEYFL